MTTVSLTTTITTNLLTTTTISTGKIIFHLKRFSYKNFFKYIFIVNGDCSSNPCKNGGTCVPVGSSYSCFCGLNSIYTGKNCDSPAPMTTDGTKISLCNYSMYRPSKFSFTLQRMSIKLCTWSLYILWLSTKTLCLFMEWSYASNRWYDGIIGFYLME